MVTIILIVVYFIRESAKLPRSVVAFEAKALGNLDRRDDAKGKWSKLFFCF